MDVQYSYLIENMIVYYKDKLKVKDAEPSVV